MEVYGSGGALMVEETGELWHSPVGSGGWRPVEVEQDAIANGMRDSSWSRGFTLLSNAIIKAMREDRTTVAGAASFEDGLRVQQVLDAARTSNDSGAWVQVDGM
jgi:predicted dehydrogenase